MTDAAWTRDGETLAVVDRVGGRILFYSPDGELDGQLLRPGPGRDDLNTPLALQVREEGLLILDGFERLVRLDHAHAPDGEIRFSGKAAILDFVQAPGGDQVTIFGMWRGNGGRTGFLSIALPAQELAATLLELEPASVPWQLTSLCRPALVRTGGHLYALDFREGAVIRELDTGRRLEALPDGFSKLPSVPASITPERTPELFALLERSALPVQLHGREGRLYAVTRRAEEDGGTRWEVHRIDPRQDELEATFQLPTSAPHTLVAPGPELWAILEFGRVEAVGVRKLTGFVTLPSVWLEGADPSPLEEHVDCD